MRLSTQRRPATLVILQELEQVAVGVLYEGHRDRPPIELLWRRHRLAAGGHNLVVQGLAVFGVDIDLPHGGSHVDGTRAIEVLGQLDARAAGSSLQYDLRDAGDLGTALHGYAAHAFPEGDRTVDVADVDAVLPQAVLHVVSSPHSPISPMTSAPKAPSVCESAKSVNHT